MRGLDDRRWFNRRFYWRARPRRVLRSCGKRSGLGTQLATSIADVHACRLVVSIRPILNPPTGPKLRSYEISQHTF
jgi:hypothetical protein